MVSIGRRMNVITVTAVDISTKTVRHQSPLTLVFNIFIYDTLIFITASLQYEILINICMLYYNSCDSSVLLA